MAQPQSGILPDANTDATFITLMMDQREESCAAVRAAIAAVPDLTDSLAAQYPDSALVSVVGVGPEAWDRLYPESRPAALGHFQGLDGAGGIAPSTPGDVLLHIRSDRRDVNFELARRIMARFGDTQSLVEEINGFRYLDKRDLTGFVDGTENPTGDDRAAVALVGDEDAAFRAGSYISIQRYVHDLAGWERLAVADQEAIMARTKADNVEFASEDKPPTAHIVRVSIKEDGQSLEIMRHSMPYGTTSEHGLYFISYARRPDIFHKMLERMIVADESGHYDHLMAYSRAVTGANFFAPSRDWLAATAGQ